jgi:U3 small nucleolar ribonucleoprotein protein LCP5
MAAPTTLSALLTSLTESLQSAQEVTPKIAAIPHSGDGISLLDVKNDLLLTYLQNLVFLILLKLRNNKDGQKDKEIDEAVRAKLVELRFFLEKGARPLEEKLRFSIERFLSQARDAQAKPTANGAKKTDSDSSDEFASDEEEDDEDQDVSDADSVAEAPRSKPKMAKTKRTGAPQLAALNDDPTIAPQPKAGPAASGPDSVYRPPRRERHVMDAPSGRRERRPMKSHTMDEFIASELASGPQAEPSIGTTIVNGGRSMKTASQRAEEAERQTYEETNYTRLPKESKKEKRQKAKQGRGNKMEFGGEEWHDLGAGVERIDKLTARARGGKGAGVKALLEKSRKRGPDTVDGPRGSGEIGERFNKVKTLDKGRRR